MDRNKEKKTGRSRMEWDVYQKYPKRIPKVTERSLKGDQKDTEMSLKGHIKVTKRSLKGHQNVNKILQKEH